MGKILIKNIKIFDGTGTKPFVADVLIGQGKILAVRRDIISAGAAVLDGAGLSLAPGFINTHSHSDLEVFANKDLDYIIRQGITTEVIGQDGSSVAPVYDEIVDELAANMAPLAGLLDRPYWWRSYGDYLEAIKKANPAVRIEALIGHGTVRMCIMGNDIRKPTPDELQKMKNLIAKSMDEGAKGVSFGLIYPPGSYAETEELIEISKAVALYDGILMVHMRNEEDKLFESIDEMARVVRESGVRLHISHFKCLGPQCWGKAGQALKKFEKLSDEGFDVTFDQYPYIAGCTGLKVIVPMWAYEGGEQKFQERLANEVEYKRILDEVVRKIAGRGGAERISIAAVVTEENSWMTGKRLHEIAAKLGLEAAEAALEILRMEGPSVVAIYFHLKEEDVLTFMRSPLHGVCTDSIMSVQPHPRTYGSFPRVLRYYCRELKIFTMEEAIRKMTMEPARRLRLFDRGLIREGLSADLVLFDAETIGEKNSFDNPKVYPEGIKAVWVKGGLKYSEL